MATLSTTRSSYQNHNPNMTLRREPFACPRVRGILRDLATEAESATTATTQAAYLLRLNKVRSLLKSIG